MTKDDLNKIKKNLQLPSACSARGGCELSSVVPKLVAEVESLDSLLRQSADIIEAKKELIKALKEALIEAKSLALETQNAAQKNLLAISIIEQHISSVRDS